jgi:hypothetical protein
MKCDYCKKKSEFNCGAFLERETVEIYSCRDHLLVALHKQKSVLMMDALRYRIKSVRWDCPLELV